MKLSRVKKPVAVAALSILSLASAASILFFQMERRPKPDFAPVQDLAGILAEETAAIIGKQGKVVLITLENETSRTQTQVCENRFKALGGISAVVEMVSSEQMIQHRTSPGFPARLFLQLLEKHPDASAIVSFQGPPDFSDRDLGQLPEKMPKIVVFAAVDSGLKRLLGLRVIQLAILRRPHPLLPGRTPSPGPTGEVSARQQFNQKYEILTPESDLSHLSESPSPGPIR